MKTVIETIGVGSKEDLYELINLTKTDRVEIEYIVYHKDYDPTPWNLVVKGSEEDLLWVLRRLDDQRIYYETTCRLPTTS